MDRSKPKGPDYIIIDNFEEIFRDKKIDIDLIEARKEAKLETDQACNKKDETC